MPADSEQENITVNVPVLPSKTVPRNRLIMLRYLEGQHIDEIAAHFDLHPGTISGILNSPLVRQELESMSQNATERVANLTDEALDLVRDTMRGKSNSELKFKAANSLLDRNRELNPKQSDSKELMEGLGEGMVRAIGKQLREIEKEKEVVIQIEETNGGENEIQSSLIS